MSILHVYPGSRAVREAVRQRSTGSSLLPRMLRMNEFEARIALVRGRSLADPTQRVLLLREAADFDGFERFRVSRQTIRFFTRSKDFFRFLEELAWERVDISKLKEADAYAEYEEHLNILEELRRRYGEILEREGLYDRMFIPEQYSCNEAFIDNYERIELYLEGYLSRFEMELLEEAAGRTELIVHWRSTPFNEKMRERFSGTGIDLPRESRVSFSWTEKRILEHADEPLDIKASVLATEERYEQVALAMAEIDAMVHRGIPPEKIALVLPREEFRNAFELFDKMDNLNFSMGYSFEDSLEYRVPSAILGYWKRFDAREREFLENCGYSEILNGLNRSESVDAERFAEIMRETGIPGFIEHADSEEESREERAMKELSYRFARLYRHRRLLLKEWLFLWLRELEELRLDDVRGGKVTVMGVLETRGVSFDGVVLVDFNDGVVPSLSGKDRFLDSRVRRFAGLPDRRDREALQKHYYARLLEQADEAVIIYCRSDNRLPSRFLYELGLSEGKICHAPRELLYSHAPLPISEKDPVVDDFNPFAATWSATRLKIWLQCRRRFYYRYIKGLEEKASDEINEGVVLHRILEELYRRYDHFADRAEMERELRRISSSVLENEDLKGLYLGSYWERMLEGYISEEIRHFSEGWRVESRELSVEGDIGGLRFVGRIDRLDRRGEERMAIDYKSGSIKESNRKSSLDKLKDFQMSIYDLLLRPVYGKFSMAYVTILKGGKYIEPLMLEEKNALLMEHLEELKSTRSFAARRCDDLSACQYCPYQLLCERGEYL